MTAVIGWGTVPSESMSTRRASWIGVGLQGLGVAVSMVDPCPVTVVKHEIAGEIPRSCPTAGNSALHTATHGLGAYCVELRAI